MPRTTFLADIPISIFRQAPELPDEEGARPSLADRLISQDYAHRRDRRVSQGELASGFQTFGTVREYIVRKDTVYTLPDNDRVTPLGNAEMGTEPLGSEPSPPATARDGANAKAGLLLRDDETGEFFTITGVTLMPDNKREVLHCDAVRGNP